MKSESTLPGAEAAVATTGEIIEIERPALGLPGQLSPVGLDLPTGLSFDRWMAIGETLRGIERGVLWWVGDWLRYGERSYGEKYSQALDVTDYSYQTLRDAAWVAGEFELSRRRDNLSFSHHKEVAALPAETQDELLDCAANQNWSRNELRTEVNRIKNRIGADPAGETCTVDDLQSLVTGNYKFGTVYADPPWRYGNQGTRAATGNHYGGMSVDEIAALPIADLTAADAHLHLWTTNAFLFECPRIMAAWGFEYKSCFVWVKPQMGIGNYWRVSHEFMLLGVKGAKSFPEGSKDLKSWAELDRGAHSAKPEQVRDMIKRSSPGPRLELFGRGVTEGWTVWGNAIERNLMHGLARAIA